MALFMSTNSQRLFLLFQSHPLQLLSDFLNEDHQFYQDYIWLFHQRHCEGENCIMSYYKHYNEENVFLNNQCDCSDENKEEVSSPNNGSSCVTFIYNDLKGLRKGGPLSDNETKACEGRGCPNKRETKLYFPSRFACRERDDHPIVCRTCFFKSSCPDHNEGLANDHFDEELDDNQAWP